MKIIELDLRECRCLDDIHQQIQSAFGFGRDYGRNWSAFWDLLWSECDADGVIVTGEEQVPIELSKELVTMHGILRDKTELNKKCGWKAFCVYGGKRYEDDGLRADNGGKGALRQGRRAQGDAGLDLSGR